MNIIGLSEDVLEILDIIQGGTYEEKIKILAIEKVKLNLEECNREILKYESKYGMTFNEFRDLWDKGEIENKYSHEVETDYIEWEALEMEKKHWLSILKKLKA
ncbi:MAG: hypothetical protein ACPL1I_09560 [bacterium]